MLNKFHKLICSYIIQIMYLQSTFLQIHSPNNHRTITIEYNIHIDLPSLNLITRSGHDFRLVYIKYNILYVHNSTKCPQPAFSNLKFYPVVQSVMHFKQWYKVTVYQTFRKVSKL